jgi:hypothetical protein
LNYLQIANAALAVFGLAMGLVLAVVCLLYAAHVGEQPQLRGDLPQLYAATGLFLGLGLAGVAALLGHRRRWMARWWLQALPLAPVAGLGVFLLGLRT